MFFEMGAILQKKPVLQGENASRPNVFWIESTRNIFFSTKKNIQKINWYIKKFPALRAPIW